MSSTISMVELRRNAERVLRRVTQGEQLVLTYRGAPVARLIPHVHPEPRLDDPIYRLAEFAADDGESLNNDEIDAIIYGH